MKQILIIVILLIQFVAANAQDTKVEIYDVSSNSIITGFVTDSIGDSIYVHTDKSEIIAFAKSDMQGLNYGVSKEIKKLQRKLVQNEIRLSHLEFPGNYQMKNGELTKGKIIYILTKFGYVCTIVGGCLVGISGGTFLAAALVSSESIVLWGGIFIGSLYTFLGGLITGTGVALWSVIDKTLDIQSRVENRYYYTGESLYLKTTL
jgi:hypothetical protein